MSKSLALTLLACLFFLTACDPSASHWPPAVTSIADINELPSTQTDIRGIGIGVEEIKLIAQRFEYLNYFFINSKIRITDEGLLALSSLKHLNQIVIDDGSQITDASVIALATVPKLSNLIIYNAMRLTDASLQALQAKTSLKILYIKRASHFTVEAKNEIRKQLPACEIRFE